MLAPSTRHWLMLPGGERFAVTAGGVVLGRSARCDVVTAHPSASRQHAIVVDRDGGPCVMPLTKGRVEVNGHAIEHEHDVSDGDRIEIPGLTAAIVTGTSGTFVPEAWIVRTAGGARFGLTRNRFVIGSSATADLRLRGLPAEAVRLTIGAGIELEALMALRFDQAPLLAGDRRDVTTAATLMIGDHVVYLEPASDASAPTAAELAVPTRPTEVWLEFLPRGGRLRVAIGDHLLTVFLAEKRCDLIACLLRPPPPLVAGDFVPDDVLLPRLWPGRSMTRVELNVLVHRTRRDLTPLTLDPAELLERAPGGGATRLGLTPGAPVHIE